MQPCRPSVCFCRPPVCFCFCGGRGGSGGSMVRSSYLGSNPAGNTSLRNFGNSVCTPLCQCLSEKTLFKICQSLLSCAYARGSKRSHTRGKCVTCRGLHILLFILEKDNYLKPSGCIGSSGKLRMSLVVVSNYDCSCIQLRFMPVTLF